MEGSAERPPAEREPKSRPAPEPESDEPITRATGDGSPAVRIRPTIDTRSAVRAVMVVLVAVAAVWIVYLLRQPLGWLFVASFIAIAVSGPVNYLSRRMKRGLAILLVYLGILLVPVALLALLVPPIVNQVNTLVNDAPQYAADVTEVVNENERLRELDEDYDITTKLEEEAGKLPGKVGDAAGVLADIGIGLVNGIFAAVTILILSIFMVGAGPRWRRTFIKVQAKEPERARAWNRMFDRIGAAVANYVLGALIQATIAGVSAYVVLLLIGAPSPAALAVVVFLLDLIPLIGATIGAVVVGIVTLFGDVPFDPIVWTAYSVVYQQVENNVIQPRIQARAVQLEPFLVIVSVLFGSALFGLPGALLAIPVAASIQIAVREYLLFRRDPLAALIAEPKATDPEGEPPEREQPGAGRAEPPPEPV
ncbi:MAG TPA: AI-2E family transporter [Thermoleophilaceae bacterium]